MSLHYEFRWIQPAHTTIQKPILQVRAISVSTAFDLQKPIIVTEWKNIPVVSDNAEYEKALKG